ncbi:MAG: Holliday junction branch migration DNA helicase RuvB [Mycoplasmataceae bacterium]|nr:Holliday junction branch migration DNA helicase RuvB [Mycoplasmataceae bacterium]
MNNTPKSLRPRNFKNFIGQKKLVQTIKVIIKSSQEQKKYPDHILFYGPPGLGKTTLAELISIYSKRKIIFVQGSLLLFKPDILAVFSNISEGDIIFIDEIHSINKNLEELMYSALEDSVIDISIGPEGDKKIVRMKIQPFTLIGATTNISKISQPIKDRFGLLSKFEKYSLSELSQIIKNSALLLKCDINDFQAEKIATYANGTPRIGNRLLSRIIDFSYFYNNGIITDKIINKTFDYLSLYKLGLNALHIDYLKTLAEVFESKYASIDAIASILNESKDVIINDIESFLLPLKLISKTSRGRSLTMEGQKYLLTYNINPPKIN